MSTTEIISPRYRGLDTWNAADVLSALWEGQLSAIASVRESLPALALAAEAMAERLRESGRLAYVGAGASGHLAIQDGLELPQTFGWPAERLLLLMAGGDKARTSSAGPAEDDAEAGRRDMETCAVSADDAVIGVAASGTTPYTVAALQLARENGALTVALANNADTPLLEIATHPILLLTGPEVIAGSTRMNAGTAQKAALNMLSTLVMTRLGHVHDGLMVDVHIDNEKLLERGVQMLIHLTGVDMDQARSALARSDNQVKVAALVLSGVTRIEAECLLDEANGVLREALSRRSRISTPKVL